MLFAVRVGFTAGAVEFDFLGAPGGIGWAPGDVLGLKVGVLLRVNSGILSPPPEDSAIVRGTRTVWPIPVGHPIAMSRRRLSSRY
jgi:hypothetical protein